MFIIPCIYRNSFNNISVFAADATAAANDDDDDDDDDDEEEHVHIRKQESVVVNG